MPDLIYGFLGIVLAGWMGWISITVIHISHDTKKSSELKGSFEKMEKDVEGSIQRMDDRLDLFLKTEIQELKSVLKNKDGD